MQFQQVNEKTRFQVDGATSNKVRNLFNAINRLFADHVTSRNGEITCVSEEPDLSACDSFVWG